MKSCMRALLLVVCSLGTGWAWAHKPSDSYLTLQADTHTPEIRAQWDIALRDLELALHLDADGDGAIDWGELRARETELFSYALARLAIDGNGTPCSLVPGDLLVDDHSDGAYAVLRFSARCTQTPRTLGVVYRLLFDLDPTHRGLLRLDTESGPRSAVLSPEQSHQQFVLDETSRLATFTQFARDGVHHILVGYDHILFLISLLLPAVLVRREGRWLPVSDLRAAILGVLAVVTAFTLAHSITLSLAALGVVGLPSRLVESGIALSVVLAALNNIWPRVTRRVWLLAFGFGLVHGFGFASVLADLGLPRDALALALAGFNIGVEFGQLSIVLLVVPLAYLSRTQNFYRPAILHAGSGAIAVIAGVWLCSRVLGFGLG